MKEAIIDQSIELFAEKGFKETSIQDIMNELNVTKGTFYYYFKSKEQLLMEIHLQYIERLLEQQASIMSDHASSNNQKLQEMIYGLIRDIEQDGLRAKVFFREIRHLTNEHLERILPLRDQFRYNIQKVVESGMEAGEFRKDLPANIVTFGILGMTNWSYFWFQPGGEVSDREVASIFSSMLTDGMKQEK